MDRKRIIVVGVLIALFLYGLGYAMGKRELQPLKESLALLNEGNQTLKSQIVSVARDAKNAKEALAEEKKRVAVSPGLDLAVLNAIKEAGVTDPVRLIEDLRQNPLVIPEAAVLGGTMAFRQIGLINDRWVYASYEDGHIAGSAIFQWKIQDSRIIWTPILVYHE